MLKTLLLGIVLLLPTSALAASDIFLRIDGVLGESLNDKHKNDIDVVSFAWGVGPNDARKPAICPTVLTINKLVDVASPPLALAGLVGQHFPEARLFVNKVGLAPVEYLTITMKDVDVARYQTGGAESDGSLMESVELSFSEITVAYIPQGPGSKPEPSTFTYQSTKPCLKK